MCGRITLTNPTFGTLMELAHGASGFEASAFSPRYNIAPTQRHWIVRDARQGGIRIDPAVWGVARRHGRRLINLRCETLEGSKYGVAGASRCAVPADGFYEWIGERKSRRPLWFHAPEGGLLWMAGIRGKDDRGDDAFAVVTCPANGTVGQAHSRMPVLLDRASVARWLTRDAREDALIDLLTPAPDSSLEVTPVSPRVNRVEFDDPACITPAQDPQLALF